MPHAMSSYLVYRLYLTIVVIFCFQYVEGITVEEFVASQSSPHRAINQPERAAEIISVTGCERPSRPKRSRETYRCFADKISKRPVFLSVRGRGFPTDASLRVLLQEHTPIPLDKGAGNDADLIVMECVDVQRSKVFPQQILTCTLPHPSEVLHQKPQWLDRLKRRAMWMDIRLLVTRHASGHKGQQAVNFLVLSRAVQLDLARGTSTDEVSDDDLKDIHDSPLEGFFRKGYRATDAENEWLQFGIGGLKDQLHALCRRVLLSRLPSIQGTVASLNLPHVRGVMLHGPPGNGKTLIARTLARILDDSAKVSIVNAADILSKYVGDSEKKLRDLFNDGDNDSEDETEEGTDGGSKTREGRLHAIIIDEIEAIFRLRGGLGDESSVKALYDGLTNQLLTLMDGLGKTKNVLIIGLTNQLHVVDRALLRPGRFEVVIEIPFPNLEGRMEMFFIHTRKLQEKDYLASDIDLQFLAARTGGFSGADIAGTVRAAVSYALVRYHKNLEQVLVDGDDVYAGNTSKEFQVTREDFAFAIRDILESKMQIMPGEFLTGTPDVEDIKTSASRIVDYDGSIARSKDEVHHLLKSIYHSRITRTAVVIIYGPPGTGKTILAQELVKLWPFDITKYVTYSRLNSNRDTSRSDEIITALRTAALSRGSSSVVIDNVEQYLRAGDSLSGETLSSIINEFKTSSHPLFYSQSKKDAEKKSVSFERLLIITTSNREILFDLMQSVEYDLQLSLQHVHRKDLVKLLCHYGILSSNTTVSGELVRAYPPRFSYRQFLKITDLALWRAHDARVRSTVASDTDQDTAFYSVLNSIFVQGGSSSVADGTAPTLESKRQQSEFGAAVRSVVSAMGLKDAFDDLITADNVIEVDEVSW